MLLTAGGTLAPQARKFLGIFGQKHFVSPFSNKGETTQGYRLIDEHRPVEREEYIFQITISAFGAHLYGNRDQQHHAKRARASKKGLSEIVGELTEPEKPHVT